ncbi:stalk domain-containing protein [Paenibacillus filicis]|uniref:Stalk domain-containing protein n=1 Tax=Paenibacillus gyeongsangnamensis TaxID=3388067 RepID=A0ABT4QFT2_9BACL|nr:stalk domain-containing protein [Paenibacillus filicis]MCZ8515716.1 stalk domain-containing protein [Paenibacillus filicis]
MKKIWLLTVLAFTVWGASSASAETAGNAAPVSDPAPFLKAKGATDKQIERLGGKLGAAAYAAETRKLEGETLQRFLENYLYVYPPMEGRGGSVINGVVEFADGTMEGVALPHGPYGKKPVTYEVNGTNVFMQREIPMGRLPAKEILEELGFAVDTGKEGELSAAYGARVLKLRSGEASAGWDGTAYELKEAAEASDQGLLMPEGVLTDVLGVRLERNERMRTYFVQGAPKFVKEPAKGNANLGYTVKEAEGWFNPELNVQWNGNVQPISSIPLNVDGINYLPVEEAAGLVDRTWENYGVWLTPSTLVKGVTDRVRVMPSRQEQVKLYTGYARVYMAGRPVTLKHAPVFYINRWYLPINDLAELAGFTVQYDNETKMLNFLKPEYRWMMDKLQPGMERNLIRARFGNPTAVVLGGETGDRVWRYDGLADPKERAAEEEAAGEKFDGVDIAGLLSGKLNYQAFLDCDRKELIFREAVIYYPDGNGGLRKFTLKEDGSRRDEAVPVSGREGQTGGA